MESTGWKIGIFRGSGTLHSQSCDMLCAVVDEALAPRAWDLNPDALFSPLPQMCHLRNPNLSCIQF